MSSERKYMVQPRKKRRNTDPAQVRRAELLAQKRQTLLNLRMAGASYMDIVKANIGYKSTGHVAQDMKIVLAEFQYETPEDVLVLDLARLDDMQRRLAAAFYAGDLAQAGMILRVMQFRRETLGITPEVIAQRSTESKALVNNGIMVVQGSAEDYLKSMMQAAGASPEQQQAELERVAASNRKTAPTEEILDAEIVPERPRKKLRKPAKLNKSAAQKSDKEVAELDDSLDTEELETRLKEVEQNDNPLEKLPSLQLSDPLLSIDFPEPEKPKKKRLRIKVKVDDPNINDSPGMPYRAAPRKPTRAELTGHAVGKGAKSISSGPNRDLFPADKPSENEDVGIFDEIEVETIQESIE